MIAALMLVLALQDPKIEKVERVVGDVNRAVLWTPLRVTVSSAGGYTGDLLVRSEFGFTIARPLQLAAGGRATVLVPALDPKSVSAGAATFDVPRGTLRPDRIVLVDSRLPYASELTPTPQILYQKIAPEDLQELRPRGLLEAADLILLKEAAGPGPGIVAPSREDADKAVAALGEPAAVIEAVDRALWPLAPREGWVPAKKTWTLFFTAVYAFASFVALAVLARRFPKFGLVCVIGVAVLGMAGYAVLFPRGHVFVAGESVEDDGRELRLWFVGSALDLETSLKFPRLVKPVFATSGGADEPFTLRIEDQGCRVEGLRVGPDRMHCFGGTEYVAPSKAAVGLYGAVRVQGGRAKYIGDVLAGAPLPPVGDGEGPAHRSPGYDAWSRFVGKDGVFGLVEQGGTPSRDLSSPDLADERQQPRAKILRLP
jgi:hypothetical protein